MTDSAVLTREIGTSRSWSAGVSSLTLDERYAGMRPERWYRTVRQMVEEDATVGAISYAVEMMCRRVTWHVEPADDSPEAAEIAEFVETCIEDVDGTWPDQIADILSMFYYGFSLLEVIYKRRLGDAADPILNSAYDDGRIGWRKWGYRPPESKVEWVYTDGNLSGFKQRLPDGSDVVIPREKFLLFTMTARYGRAEGTSVLRRAYRPWYHKNEIETAEAIGIYRDLAGVPYFTVPSDLLTADGSTPAGVRALEAFEEVKRMGKNLHAGAQAAVILPSNTWEDKDGNPTAQKQYELKLIASGGSKQFDTNATIQRYRSDIAMTMLADVILIGNQDVGTYATAISKDRLLLRSLAAALDAIGEEISVYAIRRLVKLNGWPVKLAPKLDHSDPEQADLKMVGEFLVAMQQAGQLPPLPALTRFLLELAGLPSPPEGEDLPAPAPVPEPEPTPSPTPEPEPTPGTGGAGGGA